MSKIIPVIMSGGAGSRLWPLSRQAEPKQLLPLVTEKTMVQETVARFSGDIFFDPVFICNRLHTDSIEAQMAEIGCDVDALIVEPIGRNTAPCAVVAACHAAQKENSLVLLVPADHHVKNPEAFQSAIKKAASFAQDGYLVTFGIEPDAPETGYGYIAQGEPLGEGVYKVASFKEKPDVNTAHNYLDAGGYSWNAGIFLFSPDSFLSEVGSYAPEILTNAQLAFHNALRKDRIIELDKVAFKNCPSESIDYAVMEHTKKAAIVPCDIGWNDIGSYTSLLAARVENESDSAGNCTRGSVIVEGSQGCFVDTDGLPVSLVGVSDVAVIVKGGEILIVNLNESQSVKKVVKTLKELGANERL